MASAVLLLLLCMPSAWHSCGGDGSGCGCRECSIRRDDFPAGFMFGAASSAYQFEGAYDEKGKGQSMWDNYTHTYPDKILDHKNGDVAVNFYHYYKEDVKIARDLGLDAYRISVSWSRILPGGTVDGGVNKDGIDYYSDLVDEFLANGIVPFVTILHFDLPQALQDAYGGFLSPRIVDDFVGFADLLFRHLGDRVKHWITINEPWTVSMYGYSYGWYAPGRCSASQNGGGCTGGNSATEPYLVAHNVLRAHSAVVNLYRTKYQIAQKGQIGISVVSYWFEALDSRNENQRAKGRALDFMLGWFMEPLVRGHYPETMRIRVGDRLPEFNSEEKRLLKGSFDFIGFNYYASIYAFHESNSTSSYVSDSGFDITGMKNGIPIGQRARNSSRIYIYPKGLRQILRYIKENYDDPLIYITENGIDEAADESNATKDSIRKKYIRDHLSCLHEAVKEAGVDVRGYFVWSLMDNFEWNSGFSVRFGLYYVDYRDAYLRRYPKSSALWYKNFLLNHQHGIADE